MKLSLLLGFEGVAPRLSIRAHDAACIPLKDHYVLVLGLFMMEHLLYLQRERLARPKLVQLRKPTGLNLIHHFYIATWVHVAIARCACAVDMI